jgi:cell migration-inducing and hyaluronan-binding protein
MKKHACPLVLSLVTAISLSTLTTSLAYAQMNNSIHKHEASEHEAHHDAHLAEAVTVNALMAGQWSDASIWSSGKVPSAGSLVTIGEGIEVVLDSDTAALHGLNLNGKLSFADNKKIELTTEWVLLTGELEIGSSTTPYSGNATITLTDHVTGENINGMGDRGILLVGGTLNLHGNRKNSWTKLTSTAEVGSKVIEVMDGSGWREGDQIVLASTDFNPRQAERRYIDKIRGNKITLDEPLEFMHFGQITYGVDERGEVGLLSRNIKIQASEDAEKTFFGGHIMAMVTSKMYVDGVELTRMGQNLELARYPIHWHLVGEGGAGQYLVNTAIYDTYNRCVTVHGTNDLKVENNVTYNTVGHCFFMEDGIETGNEFIRNLAIQTKCHTSLACDPTNLAPFGSSPDGLNFKTTGQDSPHILIPSDNTASSFWITNPDNTYRGNVAAGSDSTGFWFAFPEHPTGAFEGSEISKATWPRRTKFREFSGNVAHSNFDGFMGDRAPRADGHFAVGGYIALSDPSDPNSKQVESVVEDFTTYKNRNSGIWARGELHLYKGLKMADNGIGFTHASGAFGQAPYTSRVVDSVFVGESENIGNPESSSEMAYGRSLPQPMLADFPIRAYEFYDYHHQLENNTFINYQDNETRKTGAVSYLLFTSFGMSSNNYLERSTFINAKPVYFPRIDNRWSNDDYGNTIYKTSVFNDRDGTITGIPGSYILNDTGYDADDKCESRASWNALVCTGDMGRMTVGGGGPVGFSFGGGSRPTTPPVFEIAPGGGRIRGRPPEGPEILLSRNGKKFKAESETNVRSGSEYRVETMRETLNLNVKELDEGSWVIFELPGFSIADKAEEQRSLDNLHDAKVTSFYKGEKSLWVKLVSTGDVLGSAQGKGPGPGESVSVSR